MYLRNTESVYLFTPQSRKESVTATVCTLIVIRMCTLREYRNVCKKLSQSNIKPDFCIGKNVRDSVPMLLGGSDNQSPASPVAQMVKNLPAMQETSV